jgi:N-ethylmaleimide reductase
MKDTKEPLFTPYQLGPLLLKNRLVMAPMTRNRADGQGVVPDITAQYYGQRAGAGLIITEGVNISRQAEGSPFSPGLYTPGHVAAWREVTDEVHRREGKIFAQLWHTGRVGHSVDKNGELPVSASALPIADQKHYTTHGPKAYETPRALTTAEVKAVVEDYKSAAANALEAGFDGVELHGAFGYLPNQFLVDGVNHREDEYGGSIENRTRFVLEIMAALVAVWGPDRAGIKLSPSIPYNGMIDTNPEATFGFLIGKLNELPLAYLHLMQPLFPIDAFPHWPKDVLTTFGGLFDKPIMVNGGYTKDSAEQEIRAGRADLVSFGALFLANPDLPIRFAQGAPLNTPDRNTFYKGGENGYTDYPFLAETEAGVQ